MNLHNVYSEIVGRKCNQWLLPYSRSHHTYYTIWHWFSRGVTKSKSWCLNPQILLYSFKSTYVCNCRKKSYVKHILWVWDQNETATLYRQTISWLQLNESRFSSFSDKKFLTSKLFRLILKTYQFVYQTKDSLIHWQIIVKLLALALTNLVLDLANLVTNLAKPSLV